MNFNQKNDLNINKKKIVDEFINKNEEFEEHLVEENGDNLAIISNLNRSTGSAMYTFGDSIVQCSLFGPSPISSNLNLIRKNYLSIFLYPMGQTKNAIKDKSLSYYEYFFKRTFTPMMMDSQMPRSRTHIILNELEQGSFFITTALNAITLAMVDSGYALNYCLGTSGMILDRSDGKLYSEREFLEKMTKSIRHHESSMLNFETCPNMKAKFYIINNNTKHKTVSLLAEGCKFSIDDVLEAQKKSQDTTATFFDFIRSNISQRFV